MVKNLNVTGKAKQRSFSPLMPSSQSISQEQFDISSLKIVCLCLRIYVLLKIYTNWFPQYMPFTSCFLLLSWHCFKHEHKWIFFLKDCVTSHRLAEYILIYLTSPHEWTPGHYWVLLS